VTWPDEAELKKAIETRPLYGSGITPYVLLEYDTSQGGDTHVSIETIEHVLPQSADAAWRTYYGEKQVSADTDALPNLVPCTGKMNSSLGNQPYDTKKSRFGKDSKFKSTREFSTKYPEWTADAFKARAAELGEWAVDRWPHDRPTSA
jgi:hypothetical protein